MRAPHLTCHALLLLLLLLSPLPPPASPPAGAAAAAPGGAPPPTPPPPCDRWNIDWVETGLRVFNAVNGTTGETTHVMGTSTTGAGGGLTFYALHKESPSSITPNREESTVGWAADLANVKAVSLYSDTFTLMGDVRWTSVEGSISVKEERGGATEPQAVPLQDSALMREACQREDLVSEQVPWGATACRVGFTPEEQEMLDPGDAVYHVITYSFYARVPDFAALCIRDSPQKGGGPAFRLKVRHPNAIAEIPGPIRVRVATPHPLLEPLVGETLLLTLSGVGMYQDENTLAVASPGGPVTCKAVRQVVHGVNPLPRVRRKAPYGFFKTQVTYSFVPLEAGLHQICFDAPDVPGSRVFLMGERFNFTAHHPLQLSAFLHTRGYPLVADVSSEAERFVVVSKSDIQVWSNAINTRLPFGSKGGGVALRNQTLWLRITSPEAEYASAVQLMSLSLVKSALVAAVPLTFALDIAAYVERTLYYDRRLIEGAYQDQVDYISMRKEPPDLHHPTFWNRHEYPAGMLRVYDLTVMGGAILAVPVTVQQRVTLHPNQTILCHATVGDPFAFRNSSLGDYLGPLHTFGLLNPNGSGYSRAGGGLPREHMSNIGHDMSLHPVVNEGGILADNAATMVYEGVSFRPLLSTRSHTMGPGVVRRTVRHTGETRLSQTGSEPQRFGGADPLQSNRTALLTPYLQVSGKSIVFARDVQRTSRVPPAGSPTDIPEAANANSSAKLLGPAVLPERVAGQWGAALASLCGAARSHYVESFSHFFEPYAAGGAVGGGGGAGAEQEEGFAWGGAWGAPAGGAAVAVSGTLVVGAGAAITIQAGVEVSVGHLDTQGMAGSGVAVTLGRGQTSLDAGGTLHVYGGTFEDLSVKTDAPYGEVSNTRFLLGGGVFDVHGIISTEVQGFALCEMAELRNASASSGLRVRQGDRGEEGMVAVFDGLVHVPLLSELGPSALLLLRGVLSLPPAVLKQQTLMSVTAQFSGHATVVWDAGPQGLALQGGDVHVLFNHTWGMRWAPPKAQLPLVVVAGAGGGGGLPLASGMLPRVTVARADVVFVGGSDVGGRCADALEMGYEFVLDNSGATGEHGRLSVEGCVKFAAPTTWHLPQSTAALAVAGGGNSAAVFAGSGARHGVVCAAHGMCRGMGLARVEVTGGARLEVGERVHIASSLVEVFGASEIEMHFAASVGGDMAVSPAAVLRTTRADGAAPAVAGNLRLDGFLQAGLAQCGGVSVSVGGDLALGEGASLGCASAAVGVGGQRTAGLPGEVGATLPIATWGGKLAGSGRLLPRAADESCARVSDFASMHNTVDDGMMSLVVSALTPPPPDAYTLAAGLLAGLVGTYLVLLPVVLQHGLRGVAGAVVATLPFPMPLEWIEVQKTWGNAAACAHLAHETLLFAAVGLHTSVVWPQWLGGVQQVASDIFLLYGVRGPVAGILPPAIAGLGVLWCAVWALPASHFVESTWSVQGSRSTHSSSRTASTDTPPYTRCLRNALHPVLKGVSFAANVVLFPLQLLVLQPLSCSYVPEERELRVSSTPSTECWGSFGTADVVSRLVSLAVACIGSVVLSFMTFHTLHNLSTPLAHPPYRNGVDMRQKRVFEAGRICVVQVQALLVRLLGSPTNAPLLMWLSAALQTGYLAFAWVAQPCVFGAVNRVRCLLQHTALAIVVGGALSASVHGGVDSAQCGIAVVGWVVVVVGALVAAGLGAFGYTLTPAYAAREEKERKAHPRYDLYKWARARQRSLKKVREALRHFSDESSAARTSHQTDYYQRRARVLQLDTQLRRELESLRGWRDRFTVPFYLGKADTNLQGISHIQHDNVSTKPDVLFADSAEQELLAADFDGWVKGRLLGRGTYGSVSMAVLPGGQLLAVKVIELPEATTPIRQAPEGLDAPLLESDLTGKNATALLKVQQEVEFIRNLKHANVIEYKACLLDRKGNTINIFMEYAVGGSLAFLVKKCAKRLPEDTVRLFIAQVLQGLAFLHSKGIIHRDIKGENVLLDANGTAKLADFGCAKELASATRMCGTFAGSPYWMAPEVIRNKGYDAKADIWSVGCTTVEALNRGQLPWREQDSVFAAMYHISKSKAMPDNIPSGLSELCSDFLRQCFTREWSERPGAEVCLGHPWLTGPKAVALLPLQKSARSESAHEAPQTTEPGAAAMLDGPPASCNPLQPAGRVESEEGPLCDAALHDFGSDWQCLQGPDGDDEGDLHIHASYSFPSGACSRTTRLDAFPSGATCMSPAAEGGAQLDGSDRHSSSEAFPQPEPDLAE